MKRNDKLFELIQSMSMSEKRYFKLYASRHTIGEKNNYITLFEIMEERTTYHSKEIMNELAAHSIATTHFSSDKNYLYQLILKGLSAYYASKSASLKTKEFLHQVEVLYERGLYDHCLGLMNKAKKQAKKYDLYPLLLEISLWERKALSQMGKIEEMQGALEEAVNYLALMDNMHAFMQLFYRMEGMQVAYLSNRSPAMLEKIEDFIEHPFLQNEDIPLSFQAKLHFWQVHAAYHYTVANEEKELGAQLKLVELMNSNQDYVEEFPYDYILPYGRIIQLKRNASEAEFVESLNFFREFPQRIRKRRRDVERHVYTESCRLEMVRRISLKEFFAAKELADKLLEITNRYQKQLTDPQKIRHLFLIARVEFANKDFSDGLKTVNTLMNDFPPKILPETQGYGKILNLMIHFELGNYSVVRHALQGTIRYFQTLHLMDDATKLLFQFLRKIIKRENYSPTESSKLFSEFYANWEKLILNGSFHITNYLDIELWTKSHIGTNTFR